MERLMMADTPLLATKLCPPAIEHDLLERPRLLRLLDDARHHPLTLIAAPAGFGKTTLAASWLHQWGLSSNTDTPPPRIHHPACAWVTLDAHDNEPTQFWRYVLTAFERVLLPTEQPAVSFVALLDHAPIVEVVTALINHLLTIPSHYVLILDAYDRIEVAAIHQTMLLLLRFTPPNLHLVIVARSDPPLPIARLRAQRDLLEIRSDHLRCTADETGAFVRHVLRVDLPDAAIAPLLARTEGWFAGLRLLNNVLIQRSTAAAALADLSGTHRYIVDFVSEEILDPQPPAIRQFLLRTSILERMCAPLCDAVLGRPGSQAVLEALERANLFVQPLGAHRQWYRYHPLVADALRWRLAQIEGANVAVLQARATAWLARHLPVDEEAAPDRALEVVIAPLAAVVAERAATAPPGLIMPDIGRSDPALNRANAALIEPLTAREIEVLHLLAQGASNQQIAAALIVSVNTVKRHAGAIMGKLAVTNRTQAVTRAYELGLLRQTSTASGHAHPTAHQQARCAAA